MKYWAFKNGPTWALICWQNKKEKYKFIYTPVLVVISRPNIPPPDLTQILIVDLVARSALFTLVCYVDQEQTSIKGTLDSASDGEMVYFWGSGHEWSNKRRSFHDGINARLFYKLDQRGESRGG